jgi:hypothetical protein
MNDGARVGAGRQACLSTSRIVAALAAVSGVALVAAACGHSSSSHVAQLATTTARGSSSSSTSAPSTQQNGALAFSRCMRSNGVTNYPDPNRGGELAKKTPQQLGVSNSQFQSAQTACIHLLPNGGPGQPTRAELPQSWSDMATFARCMRRHGVPTWPDPTRYPPHPERPTFELQPAGIDPNAPQVTPKIHECLPLLHGINPQHLGEGGS